MSSAVSPHSMGYGHSSQMPVSQFSRRTSRSSGRVEKPRSNHTSPRVMERRKTTTGAKLYATLDDHFNMMHGITPNDEAVEEPQYHQQSRPISWHPSSTQFHSAPRPSVFEPPQFQDWSRHYSASSGYSGQGSDFYSLSARNSLYPEQTSGSEYGWQPTSQPTPSHNMSTHFNAATEHMPWYLQEWAKRNQMNPAVTPQHGSSDFLPIQHPSPCHEDSTVEEDMEYQGKELVGMGLYDHPEPSLTWNSGSSDGMGKGLKLEETWQPPEEEADEEDASSDDGSLEEPPPPPTATQQNEHLRMPVSIKSETPNNMDGQSFFFDDDENASKEWWFQQLKQPSMPVRDAGIGYGWL